MKYRQWFAQLIRFAMVLLAVVACTGPPTPLPGATLVASTATSPAPALDPTHTLPVQTETSPPLTPTVARTPLPPPRAMEFPTGTFFHEHSGPLAGTYCVFQFDSDGTFAYFYLSSTVDVDGISPLLTGTYRIEGNLYVETGATFTNENSAFPDCPHPATYAWTYDGQALEFQVVDDACPDRQRTYESPLKYTKAEPDVVGTDVEVWDYVSLGSMAAYSTFPYLYAAYIENDLGVTVRVENLGIREETEGTLLWKLQKDEQLREFVSEAEVVTVWTAAKDVHYGLTWPLIDCQPKVEALKETLGPITAEILALRAGQRTLVRLLEYYNWVDLARKKGLLEKKLPCFQALNELVHQVGSQYSVPVAPVCEAFNGPDGDRDPGEKGYIDDLGFFLSPKGDVAVADLLRGLGYEFIIP